MLPLWVMVMHFSPYFCIAQLIQNQTSIFCVLKNVVIFSKQSKIRLGYFKQLQCSGKTKALVHMLLIVDIVTVLYVLS